MDQKFDALPPGSEESDGRPRLTILPQGGAICSLVEENLYIPHPDAVRRLRKSVPENIYQLFSSVAEEAEPKGGLLRTENFTLDRVEAFVLQVIEIVRNRKSSVVALVPSHKAARLGTALSLGLAPEDFEAAGGEESAQRPAVIVASSRTTVDHMPPNAADTFQKSLELVADRRMYGRAGVLYNEELYPLTGLSRPENAVRFNSRHGSIAYQGDRGRWYFHARDNNHLPIGSLEREFHLDPYVRTLVMEDAEERRGDMVPVVARLQEDSPLHGMVIKTSAFQNPLRTEHGAQWEQYLRPLDEQGIPAVVVGRTMDQPADAERYTPPNYENLIDGNGLNSGEAKVLLAHYLARATEEGITDIKDRIEYIRQKLQEYPF